MPLRTQYSMIILGLGWASGGCHEEPIHYQSPTIAPDDAGQPFVAEGTFGYKQVMQKVVDTPYGSTIQSTVAFTVGTLSAGSDDTTAIWEDTSCSYEISDLYGMSFSIEAGYLQATPPIAIHLQRTVGGTFASDQQIELRGCTLDNPALDPLPTEPDDPRVYDYDANNDPGYTIWVEGPVDGYVWAVQRYVYSVSGTIYSADAVSGLIDGYAEQSSLYSSNDAIPIGDTETDPDAGADTDFFEMIRIPDGTSCEELLNLADTLFTQ